MPYRKTPEVSEFYDDGLEQLLARTIPQEAGVYMLGVNDAYTFDRTHTSFDEFTPHILLPEKLLTNVTFTRGVLDADDPVWLAAGAGVLDRSLILAGVIVYFKLDDAGALLAFIDSAEVGLPQTVTGLNVTAFLDGRGILEI